MKKSKHILSFKLFTEDLANYMDTYPISMKQVDVSASDRSTDDDLALNTNFQMVQNAFQEQFVLPKLKECSPNYEINDAEEISNQFFTKTKGNIKNIIDSNNGDVQKTVDELIKQYGKNVVQNYIKPKSRLNKPGLAINNNTGEDFHPE